MHSLYVKQQFLTNSSIQSFSIFFIDKLTSIELCITVQKANCHAKQINKLNIVKLNVQLTFFFLYHTVHIDPAEVVNIVYFHWKEAAVRAPETYCIEVAKQ